jgi:hypothetical protein
MYVFSFQSPWFSNLFSLCHQLARVPQLSYITVTPTLVLIRLRAPYRLIARVSLPCPIDWIILRSTFATSKGGRDFQGCCAPTSKGVARTSKGAGPPPVARKLLYASAC